MRVPAIVLALAAVLAGCAGSSKPGSPRLSGSITVFAASSLTNAFTSLAKRFEAAHPGTHVKLDFDSSAVLVTQIRNGAPADVFASADEQHMQALVNAGAVASGPIVFAKNRMEIAVAPSNPERITTVSDLARPGLVVVLCATEAPCGRYADQLLSRDRVTVAPKSREIDAASTLSKVELGDADAAIVYATDVKGAGGKVAGVDIPTDQNVVATLPIATLKATRAGALASAWVEFVTATVARRMLQQQYGFLAP